MDLELSTPEIIQILLNSSSRDQFPVRESLVSVLYFLAITNENSFSLFVISVYLGSLQGNFKLASYLIYGIKIFALRSSCL